MSLLLRQIRHATCILEYAGVRFLVDPIFYDKHTLDPVKGGIDQQNPLVDMVGMEEGIKEIECILLTHTHRDHFDPAILQVFGEEVPVVCCDEYTSQLTNIGFANVLPIKDHIVFKDIDIILTKGRHGIGVVGKMMGNSYGFVLKGSDKDSVYITGDTVWCKCVEQTIAEHAPRYIVAFAGAATINGKHITMDEKDMQRLLDKADTAKVVAIHMEAWNHCRLTRAELRAACGHPQLYIPQDGEEIRFDTNG